MTSRRLAGRAFPVVVAAILVLVVSSGAWASNYIGGAYHWSDGSNPRAYVTVDDFTGSQWPVLAATTEWATEPNLDMYYDYQSCGGTGHCIDVKVINMSPPCTGAGGSGGYAFLSTSGGHLDASNTYVRLNSDCGGSSYTNRDRRALICEELGHITGLDHADSSLNDVTCMASGNIKQLYEHPRPHDFDMLHMNVYNHNDP